MKNIFLCGFMGCGKSTVGLALAPMLDMKFLDMDRYIERSAGQSVQDIFKAQGEKCFRTLEKTAARKISGMSGFVVATGGGAVLSDENAAIFKSGGVLVFIDVPFEVIASRLEEDTSRPLLDGTGKAAAMRLYEKRLPVYRAVCDFSVANADNRPAALVASDIASIQGLEKFLR